MIIDIHSHAEYLGFNVEKTIENLDALGIDKACLLSCESLINGYSQMPFENCVLYKEKFPDRFLLGYVPSLHNSNAIEKLKSAIELYDISICGEIKQPIMYDIPEAIRLYRFCGENNLPVLMHFEGPCDNNPNTNWYGGTIDTLKRILSLCPDTKFIGHATGFWSHISNDEKYKTSPYPTGKVIPGGRIEQLLEKYSNLYCDISAGSGYNALNRDCEFAKQFIVKWQDRILYGRDKFDNTLRELIEKLNLTQEVKKKIYVDNARKVLRGGEKLI